MAALEDITQAMIDAGVRTLLANNGQRTPAQMVCEVFSQMKAAQSRPLVGLNTQSPTLRRFVDTEARDHAR